MTYKNGFVGGVTAGLIITLIATGHIVVVEYTELFRNLSFLALFSVFVAGQYVTLYRAWYGKSCLGTTEDGLIVGVGFMEAIIIFLLYGFRM